MLLSPVKFKRLPEKGWRQMVIKAFDNWSSKTDATKQGIRALLTIVDGDYKDELSILDDLALSLNGRISQLIASALDRPLDYEFDDPNELVTTVIGMRVYGLVGHKTVGNRVFPCVNEVLSIRLYEQAQRDRAGAMARLSGEEGWATVPRA